MLVEIEVMHSHINRAHLSDHKGDCLKLRMIVALLEYTQGQIRFNLPKNILITESSYSQQVQQLAPYSLQDKKTVVT